MYAGKIAPLLVAVFIITGTFGVMAEGQNVTLPGDNASTVGMPSGSVPGGASAPAFSGPMVLALWGHTYYPADVVRAFVFNATDPLVSVIDPAGTACNMTAVKVNDSAYVAEYPLNQSIILANYTVLAVDNATGDAVNDTFTVVARPAPATPDSRASQQYLYLSLSQAEYTPPDKAAITVRTNAGVPAVVVVDPAGSMASVDLKNINGDAYEGTYKLDKAVVLGNYTVKASVSGNGTCESATAYFNVTAGKGADNDKKLHARYAAYDPALKAIVLLLSGNSSSNDFSYIEDVAKKGVAVKDVRILSRSGGPGEPSEDWLEAVVPVGDVKSGSVFPRLGLERDAAKASIITSLAPDNKSIHISLNDKADGCMYRLSAPIPPGYTVDGVYRDDGVVIPGGEGAPPGLPGWYVCDGILYFYDDPSPGYTVYLSPAAYGQQAVASKTLYLRPDLSMNTTKSPGDWSVPVGGLLTSRTWRQAPFVKDFVLTDHVTLYLYFQNQAGIGFGVSLKYHDPERGDQELWSKIYPLPPPDSIVADKPLGSNIMIKKGGYFYVEIWVLLASLNVYQDVSESYYPRIEMYTPSYVHVDDLRLYDESNGQASSTRPPSTIRAWTNVSDPFGAYDIENVNVTVYYPNGTAFLGPYDMNRTTAGDSWASYERNLSFTPAGIPQGDYTVAVWATESNGAKDGNSTTIEVVSPRKASATKTIAGAGGNNFTVTITLRNDQAWDCTNLYVYDFYPTGPDGFTASGFSQVPWTGPVNWGIAGNANRWGPLSLPASGSTTITYNLQGSGNYRLSDAYIVGVDPIV